MSRLALSDEILMTVEKPARYIGNEVNSVVKDKNNMFQFKLYSNLSRCLAFGEAYKVKAQAESAANSLAAFINMAEIVDKTLVVER